MYVSENIAVHPASHIFLIYIRLAEVMLLKTIALGASFGRYVMFSWALSDEIISDPLGQIFLKVGNLGV